MLKGSSIPRTNILMFTGLPVLNKKSTYYNKNKKIVKCLKYEDIYRSHHSRSEALKLLNDPFAEE